MSYKVVINRQVRTFNVSINRQVRTFVIRTAGIRWRDYTGPTGKDAYQSYLDTTTDNPVMTEEEWSMGSSMTIESNW
jgi:hypothetical protein